MENVTLNPAAFFVLLVVAIFIFLIFRALKGQSLIAKVLWLGIIAISILVLFAV